MAYVFDKIQSALADDQKANIFNPTASSAGGMSTSAPPSAGGGGASIGGATGSGRGINPAAGAMVQKQQESAAQRNSNAFQRLSGAGSEVDAKGIYKPMQGAINTADKALSTEATDYMAGQVGGANFDLSGTTLDKAVAGNGKSGKKVTNLLTGKVKHDAKDFVPTTNTAVTDPNYVANESGIANYLKDTGGANYTPGMAALDFGLTSNDRQAQAQRQNVQGAQNALFTRQDALGGKATAQAQAGIDKKLTAAQDAARKALGTAGGQIKTAAKFDAASENDRVDHMTEGDKAAFAKKEGGKVVKDAIKAQKLQDTQPERFQDDLKLLMKLGINPADYGFDVKKYGVAETAGAGKHQINPADAVTAHGQYGWKDFLDNTDASRLNRIGGWLGNGDVYQAGTVAPEMTFNGNVLSNAINQGFAPERAKMDQKITSQRDAEIAAIQARMKGITSQDLSKTVPEKITANIVKEGYSPDMAGAPDINGFIHYDQSGGPKNWMDVASPEEIGQLKRYEAQLGQSGDQYHSTGYHAPTGPGYSFDHDAYIKALQAAASTHTPPPSPAGPPISQPGTLPITKADPSDFDQSTNLPAPMPQSIEQNAGPVGVPIGFGSASISTFDEPGPGPGGRFEDPLNPFAPGYENQFQKAVGGAVGDEVSHDWDWLTNALGRAGLGKGGGFAL